jgi:hypothetical protein
MSSSILWSWIVKAVLSLTPQKKKTSYVLTIWRRSLLNKDWTLYLGGFDAISIKAVDGAAFYNLQDAADMAAKVESHALQLHLWGFHYCTHMITARDEAQRAVEACQRLGAKAYHWNAEKQWASSGDPVAYAKEFATYFKVELPKVDLYANCFADPVTEDMLSNFDYFEPMLYGTRRATIEKKFNSFFGRTDIPKSKLCAMVGTGRKDGSNSARAWGYLKPSKGRDTPSGLAQLVYRWKPKSINFFRAGMAGGEDMMIKGNTINPSLGEQVAYIRKYNQETPNG